MLPALPRCLTLPPARARHLVGVHEEGRHPDLGLGPLVLGVVVGATDEVPLGDALHVGRDLVATGRISVSHRRCEREQQDETGPDHRSHPMVVARPPKLSDHRAVTVRCVLVLSLVAAGPALADPTTTSASAADKPAGPPAALTADQIATLRAPGDEPLEVPIDQHYPRTNEWRLDVLFPELADLGGGFVGVGADQCYTLAAAAHSEYVWLIDHDPVVRDLHLVYGALIPAADSVDAFLAFFDKAARDRGRELITNAVTDPRLRKRALKTYADYGES